jgi:hypothetical protein
MSNTRDRPSRAKPRISKIRTTASNPQGGGGDTRPRRTGGARRDRTDDLKLAKLALSQLSYGPFVQVSLKRRQGRPSPWLSAPRGAAAGRPCLSPQASEAIPISMVGLGRLERPTSPLSGVRSNHLSYRPVASSTKASARHLITHCPEGKEKRRRRRFANEA